MSDANSSLPVRTEQNGDVAAKIVDGTTPSHALKVNLDGSISVDDNGGSITVDGTVELGATSLAALESITVQNGAGAAAVNIQDGGNSITVDGTVELGATSLAALENITVAGTVEIGATSLAALESITVQNGAGGSAVNIQDGGNSLTVDAVALDIRALTASDVVTANIKDATGTAFSAINPLPVTFSVAPSGTAIDHFSSSTAVAAAASANHDYTVTASKTLLLKQIEASASGMLKIEVQVETGIATGVFVTKFVQFNSTANPNTSLHMDDPIPVAAGVKVRAIVTNRDKQAQDLYSTISGQEV